MGTNYIQVEVGTVMWIYPSMFQLEVKTLLFAAFRRKLPFHRTLLHQSVTCSKTALVLDFIAFQVGWDQWWYDSTAMYCPNHSSECSTWSLFNILWNRKLMNKATTTTASRCQILPKVVKCTYIQISPWCFLALSCWGQNFELGIKKTLILVSCLCCPLCFLTLN